MKKFDNNTYATFPYESGFLLYDKTQPSKRENYKYLGFIEGVTKEGYVFNKKTYKSPQEVIEAIEKYNATLPFSPEIYNPSWRENYRIEIAIDDYLKRLGFTEENGVYSLGKVCQLHVYVDFDTAKGRIVSYNDDLSYIETNFDSIESAVGAINSIISPMFLITQSELYQALKKISNDRATTITKVKIDNHLNAYVTDMKDELIKNLEEELKKLKQL